MVVGRDLFREKAEARIAVAFLHVSEYLVVGAILLDDVDNVLDRTGVAHFLRDGVAVGPIGNVKIPRDATVVALLLAEVMAWHRKSLGELVTQLYSEFGEHHYARVDLELRPGQKERAVEHVGSPGFARLQSRARRPASIFRLQSASARCSCDR